tara:strand:+ start:2676 stop:3251 length:576 start_codon:yes stop_codon:yes gene_type:complete
MKKLLLISAIASASTFMLPTIANAADYKIDTDGAHASVSFKVSHLGYSFIQGRFNTFSGDFSYDAKDVEASKISVNVDTTSMDSNHAERDKHLKSNDFIDAGKFSTSTFVSNKVVKKADGGLAVSGELTLHGITKNVTLDAKFIGEGNDPWGGYRAGFEATTRLQLKDFGIQVIGASSYVDLNLQIEGIKQ